MPLSSDELEAFAHIARTGSFSRAAKLLHVTQSAVSQRIAHLEQTLETKLLLRDHHKISLTTAGEELLRYCQFHEQLEHDLLQKFVAKNHQKMLNGYIRIAAFSSVMQSAVMPALQPLLISQPNLQLEARNAEVDVQ